MRVEEWTTVLVGELMITINIHDRIKSMPIYILFCFPKVSLSSSHARIHVVLLSQGLIVLFTSHCSKGPSDYLLNLSNLLLLFLIAVKCIQLICMIFNLYALFNIVNCQRYKKKYISSQETKKGKLCFSLLFFFFFWVTL